MPQNKWNIKDSIIQDYLTNYKLKDDATNETVYVVKRASNRKKNPYIVTCEIVEVAYSGKLLVEGLKLYRVSARRLF